MRQKRAKAYKRLMTLYAQTFNFRQPYQVLVSDDFLLELANKQLDVAKQLATCVQGECKPMITQCCVQALYKLGREFQPVTEIAKTFERRRCNHREAIEPEDCLKDVVGATNKHRYILAVQSPVLLKTLSPIPGLPLIHFNPRHVLVLSPPSTATVRLKNKAEEERRLEGGKVMEGMEEGENVVGLGVTVVSSAADVRGGRKVKGVNPLSVKKKRTVTLQAPKAAESQATAVVEAGPSKVIDEVIAPDYESDSGAKKKRTRDGQSEGNDENSGDDGTTGNVEDGEDDGRRKRKRKRRGKGVVADAIAQLTAGELVGGKDGESSAVYVAAEESDDNRHYRWCNMHKTV